MVPQVLHRIENLGRPIYHGNWPETTSKEGALWWKTKEPRIGFGAGLALLSGKQRSKLQDRHLHGTIKGEDRNTYGAEKQKQMRQHPETQELVDGVTR